MKRLLLAILFACALAPRARAEDRELARSLFEQAAEARDQGRWDDARSLLERALEAYPQFSIGWNLVTAIERTGDLPAAERVLERMRDGGVGELSVDEQRSIVDRLDEISPRLATLLVVAPAADGRVELDDDARVELDTRGSARVRVNPGAHELGARTRDGRRMERSIEVRAGATLRVRLEPPEIAPAPSPIEVEEESRPLWKSPWLWVAVGAVLIAGGVLTAFALIDRTADPLDADFVARGL